VVAHLSSGEADGDELRRNYDYSEIMRRTAFPPDSAAVVDPEALDGQLQPEGISKVRLHCVEPFNIIHMSQLGCTLLKSTQSVQ
jgi:hypothetical protein